MIGPDGDKDSNFCKGRVKRVCLHTHFRAQQKAYKVRKKTPLAQGLIHSGSPKTIHLSSIHDSLLCPNAKHIGSATRNIHREARRIDATVVNHSTLHIE